MSDTPDVAEIEKLSKLKLKETEMQEKNPLASKQTTEQSKQKNHTHTNTHWTFHKHLFYF
ncbi:thymosin beta-4-like [Saccopteryx leptura]|uniref:thymosin beta-4-like n=1 Tax=Saccopteryx leptura TaxID=249018 RepID=UPI00339CAD24